LHDKNYVFVRFGHVLLIVALLCATGTHWMLLQSVAWAGMLANNARTASLHVAIENTFDGKHPCPLCKQIAQGKQSERKSDLQSDLKKLEFVNAPLVLSIFPPTQFSFLSDQTVSAFLFSEAPPVPPPRSLAA
jgi:hypothetical protein